MSRFLVAIVLALANFAHAQSLLPYEEPMDSEKVMYNCTSTETLDPEIIHGRAFSTSTTREFEIYPTAQPGIYLVKDGVFDPEGRGIFTVVEKWTAKLESSGSEGIFTSLTTPAKVFKVSRRNSRYIGTAAQGWPNGFTCEYNQVQKGLF